MYPSGSTDAVHPLWLRLRDLLPPSAGAVFRSLLKGALHPNAVLVLVQCRDPTAASSGASAGLWRVGTIVEVRDGGGPVNCEALLEPLSTPAIADEVTDLSLYSVTVKVGDGKNEIQSFVDVDDVKSDVAPCGKWGLWEPGVFDFCAVRHGGEATFVMSLQNFSVTPQIGTFVALSGKEAALLLVPQSSSVPISFPPAVREAVAKPVTAAHRTSVVAHPGSTILSLPFRALENNVVIVVNDTKGFGISQQLIARRLEVAASKVRPAARAPSVETNPVLGRVSQYLELVEFLCGAHPPPVVEIGVSLAPDAAEGPAVFVHPFLWSPTAVNAVASAPLPSRIEGLLSKALSAPALEAARTLLAACAKLHAIVLPPTGLTEKVQQEELSAIAAQFGLPSKGFASYFYPKPTSSTAVLEEAKLGALSAAHCKLVTLCFEDLKKSWHTTDAETLRVVSLPVTFSSSGECGDYLRWLLLQAVPITAGQRTNPAVYRSSQPADGTPKSERIVNMIRQFEALLATVPVLDAFAKSAESSATCDVLLSKLQEAVSNKLGAPTSTPQLLQRGSGRDRDCIVVPHVISLSDEPRLPEQKFNVSRWVSTLRGVQFMQQASPQSTRIPLMGEQIDVLLQKYLRVPSVSIVIGVPRRDDTLPFSTSDDPFSKSLLTTFIVQLAQSVYDVASAYSITIEGLAAFRFLTRPKVKPKRREPVQPMHQTALAVLTHVNIPKSHFIFPSGSITPSTTVSLSASALRKLHRKVMLRIGPSLGVLQAALRGATDIRIRNAKMWLFRCTFLQRFFYARRSEIEARKRGGIVLLQLALQLRFKQLDSFFRAERRTRAALVEEEKSDLAFVYKSASSWLAPLLAKVVIDCAILEMRQRVEVRGAELQRRGELVQWFHSRLMSLPPDCDELRTRWTLQQRREAAERKKVAEISRPLMEQEAAARWKLERGATLELSFLQRSFEIDKREIEFIVRRNSVEQQVRQREEQHLFRELSAAAQRRNAEERLAQQVLSSVQEPYNVSYELYWGSPTSH